MTEKITIIIYSQKHYNDVRSSTLIIDDQYNCSNLWPKTLQRRKIKYFNNLWSKNNCNDYNDLWSKNTVTA